MSSAHLLAEDEKNLVAALQAGDAQAYERIVRDYGPRLLSVARRMLRNEEDARDALQDAFLSAFRAMADFKGDSRLSSWLHRIVVNASLMRLRTLQRRPEEPIEELLPQFNPDGHLEVPATEWKHDSLERAELRRLVLESIDRLPPGHRTVLLLRDIEELSTQEVAEMLAITPNAVKIRLHRARLALQGLLDPRLRDAL